MSPFYIAKYPITNAQFQAFVEAADGYGVALWWSYSSDAREWYARNPTPQAAAFGGAAYHPRVNVTWYEAVAFCHWLNERAQPTTPLQIRLPTEQEWQYAAQSSDCPPYPGTTATIPLSAIHCKAASNDDAGHTSIRAARVPSAVQDMPAMSANGAEPAGVRIRLICTVT